MSNDTGKAVYSCTREVALRKLTPFPGNARHGDIDAIAASIQANGQYRSLVVRDTGGQLVILAGNQTFIALQGLGRETARCEIVTCPDHTARKINLVDNRASELGDMDTDALVELLSYLDGDYDGTGYTDTDVDTLIDPPPPEPDTDPEPTGSDGYTLTFPHDAARARWYTYLGWLTVNHPGLGSDWERIDAHLTALGIIDD